MIYYYLVRDFLDLSKPLPAMDEWTEFWCFKPLSEALDVATHLAISRVKAGELKVDEPFLLVGYKEEVNCSGKGVSEVLNVHAFKLPILTQELIA